MKRIAAVFEENIFDRKGSFRAKLERVRHLMEQGDCSVDVWCIQVRYTWLVRLLLDKRYLDGVSEADLGRPKEILFEGIPYHMLWLDYSILDHFLFFKLCRCPWFYPRFLKKKASRFQEYDLLSAHGFEGAFLARAVEDRYGIPYCVSWHGSDIHTKPFKYPCIRPLTAALMAGARMNFFVSQALLEQSEAVGPGNKMVLYNGCDGSFGRMSQEDRSDLRRQLGLAEDDQVVGFVGNLVPLKNADLLPDIFSRIRDLSDRPVRFSAPNIACAAAAIGPLPPGRMSIPITAKHAATIAEVLDARHLVAPGEGFVDRFARAVVEALSSGEVQAVPEAMSWDVTARTEIGVYRQISSRE